MGVALCSSQYTFVAFISDCLTDVTAYLGRSLLQTKAREVCQLLHANVPMQPPTSWESSLVVADGFYVLHADLVDLRLFAPSSLCLCLSASQGISIARVDIQLQSGCVIGNLSPFCNEMAHLTTCSGLNMALNGVLVTKGGY